MSRILYIRHAQASFRKADYDQLSELGYRQATKLGEYLLSQKIAFDKIYLGPLKRHQQTLQMVQEVYEKNNLTFCKATLLPELDEHKGPEILKTIMSAFLEQHEQAKNWSMEAQKNPSLMRKNYLRIFHFFMELWAEGNLAVPHPKHLEDWKSFRQKVSRGVEKIISDPSRGITVGVFTSGGTISATLGHVLEMTNEKRIIELNGKVKNTAISEFLFSKGKITLQSFNEMAHLEKEEITFV